jgi:hypothetical protein
MARLNITTTSMWPAGPQGEAVAVDELPDWFETWEVTGLLGVEDKNGDGRIQYYNDANPAMANWPLSVAGKATSLSPSTVTSSCWPTRRSHSFRAG